MAPNRPTQVRTSFRKHLMADTIAAENDVFITDLESMPDMYRTADTRKAPGINTF